MNRTSAFAAVLIAAGLALGGCAGPLGDFHPLYATAAGPSLSRIETRAPDGRVGYLLREQLDDAFGLDRGKPPLYRLTLLTKQTRTPRGLRIDNVANRYELVLVAKYVLSDVASRKILTQGLVVSTVTYDSADQPYAAVSANLDGQKRIAADAAQRMRVALGAYFANPEANGVNAADAAGDQVIETLTDRLSTESVDSPGAKAQSQPGRDPVDRTAPQ